MTKYRTELSEVFVQNRGIVSLGLITNRGLVEQVPAHFTSVFIHVGKTEHK